jgi:serine O-acetyltransferase
MGNKYFLEDYKRYKQELGFVFHEPSIIIVFIYRMRKYINRRIKFKIIRILIALVVEPIYFFLTLLFGIYLPKGCEIGPGLMIHHFGGIILNPNVIIGKNCTLRHNVTIGNRRTNDDVPIIGDNVDIGTGAVIIGKIIIGNFVSIGANAVVLSNVPDNHIAVGNPARIIAKNNKH